MKHLFVTDLDGTLLNSHSRVSDHTARMISSMSRNGALITVATARTPATVEPLLHNTYTSLPAIVMTGAAWWNRTSRTFIHPHFLMPETAAFVRRICREEDVEPFRYQLNSDATHLEVFHAPRLNPAEKSFYDQRQHLALKRFYLKHEPDYAECERTILLFATGPSSRIAAAAERLKGYCNCSISHYPDIFLPDTSLLEIMAPGISKAQAVVELADRTGADRVTVFGDNLNDLPMMAVADVAVAVANAQPEVIESADLVIGSNNEDAVPEYIHSVLRHNRQTCFAGKFSQIAL